MPGAGALKERVSFEQKTPDELNRAIGPWRAVFKRQAQVTWLRGSEAVMQARLQSSQPVVVTVRDSAAIRNVDASWRLTILRRPNEHFSITGVSPSKDAGFLDILATVNGVDDE